MPRYHLGERSWAEIEEERAEALKSSNLLYTVLKWTHFSSCLLSTIGCGDAAAA